MDAQRKVDPMAVRTTAADLVSDQPSGGGNGTPHVHQVAELHWFVNETITYVPDPRSSNYVAPPDETLETEAGDCDCQSVLVASLFEAIGARTRLVDVTSADGRSRHLFTQVCLDDAIHDTDSVTQSLIDYYYEKDGWWPDAIHMDWDDGRDWYLADTAMGRFVGDVEQLIEAEYAHWTGEEEWSWHDVTYHYP